MHSRSVKKFKCGIASALNSLKTSAIILCVNCKIAIFIAAFLPLLGCSKQPSKVQAKSDSPEIKELVVRAFEVKEQEKPIAALEKSDAETSISLEQSSKPIRRQMSAEISTFDPANPATAREIVHTNPNRVRMPSEDNAAEPIKKSADQQRDEINRALRESEVKFWQDGLKVMDKHLAPRKQ